MLTQIVREEWPDTQDEDLPEALSQIDQSDPTVGARIMAHVFPPGRNNYYCRGLGQGGDGVFKNTPGFARKSTSSRAAQLQEQLQAEREERERQAMLHQAEREETRAQLEANQRQMEQMVAQQAQMASLLQSMQATLQAQGLVVPPPPPPSDPHED